MHNINSFALKKVFVVFAALTALAFGLSWLSNPQYNIQGWLSFWLLLIGGLSLLWGCFILLRQESPPSWLMWLMLGAVLLRLGLGVLFSIVLPVYGWGSDSEKAGYVMKDAYKRDIAAWELAHSNKPLWAAFTQDIRTDQYGGLLFFSALVYRYLGAEHHQPLLIVVAAAFISSITILFSWAFIRLITNETAARIGAWIIALYPEAVLLGSSQMREAFIMSFAAAAFYGLAVYILNRQQRGLWWLLGSLLLSLAFSPPFLILLLGALLLLALGLIILRSNSKTLTMLQGVFRLRILLLLFLIAIVAGGVGLWLSWGQIAPKGITNIWDLIQWWLRKAAAYQLAISHQDSGWLQREFRKIPDVLHFPVILLYGAMRPFLPAAIIGYGNPVWYAIAIWRSLGWSAMLVSIVFATLRLWLPPQLNKESKIFWLLVCLIVWLGIFISAYRGGGDDWDSPRYRVMFVSLQTGLAAWVWSEAKRNWHHYIILRRIAIAGLIFLAWFFPWYMRRYHGFEWQVISIFHTISLGFSSAVLYFIWDCARMHGRE